MVSPHADSFGILFSFFFVGVLFCSWKLLKFLLEAKYKRDSFTKGEKKGGGEPFTTAVCSVESSSSDNSWQ